MLGVDGLIGKQPTGGNIGGQVLGTRTGNVLSVLVSPFCTVELRFTTAMEGSATELFIQTFYTLEVVLMPLELGHPELSLRPTTGQWDHRADRASIRTCIGSAQNRSYA